MPKPSLGLYLSLCLRGLVLVPLLTGCQSARVAEPLAAKLGGNEPDAQMEFWHQLADQPVTSNDDAFHGLLLYLDGADAAADYASRVQTLKDRPAPEELQSARGSGD
jgi:hypothetical protein